MRAELDSVLGLNSANRILHCVQLWFPLTYMDSEVIRCPITHTNPGMIVEVVEGICFSCCFGWPAVQYGSCLTLTLLAAGGSVCLLSIFDVEAFDAFVTVSLG